jgi:CorA-like Mg2+ transporter protein
MAEPIRVYSLDVGHPVQAKPVLAPGSEKSGPPRLSIVVLPFANIGGDPEQQHFVGRTPGNVGQARAFFDRALSADPNNVDALVGSAWAESRRVVSAAIEANRNNPPTYLNLTAALPQVGRLEAAHVSRRGSGFREILTSVFEAANLLEQQRQGVITRQLAAWAAILAVPTAIAGIYGMNFANMPELKTDYGYFIVLGVIALLCSGLYVRFKKARWL